MGSEASWRCHGPENPISGTGPLADLARALRLLRDRAGSPGYRELAAKTHYSPSVLAEAASGKSCPTWPAVLAFAQACGGRTDGELRALWLKADAALTRQKATPKRRIALAEPVPVHVKHLPSGKQPEPALAAQRPDPAQARTAAQYVRQLRALRAWAGQPGYKEIARRSGGFHLPASTLYDALSPARPTLPRLELVQAIITALAPDSVDAWVTAWRAIRLRQFEQANPMPPGGSTATGGEPLADHPPLEIVHGNAFILHRQGRASS